MPNDFWDNWYLNENAPEESLRELARYANPDQVRRLGIGLGGTALNGRPAHGHAAKARSLARQFVDQKIGYTLEPFNTRQDRQIVRTTAELMEGAGTCLDFAISVAALCVSENIPVILAVAVAENRDDAHAFVIVQEEHPDAEEVEGATYVNGTFNAWHAAFQGNDPIQRYLIDATPLEGGGTGDLDERRDRTMGFLNDNVGIVHAVSVQNALAGNEWKALPGANRELGITAWLPDLPPDLRRRIPSRANAEQRLLDATGRIVLTGAPGVGKSTMALTRARVQRGGRGWYLDGSDRRTLLRSLAAAESQSRGAALEDEDVQNLATLAAQARGRLARSHYPWVVVVDNANRPADVIDLLPVPHGEHLLIVTTTDMEWARGLNNSAWHVEELTPLSRELDTLAEHIELHDEELLPGMVRIAQACDRALLTAAAQEPPKAHRLVRAALGGRPGDARPWPESALARAVTAASFMPAEQITVRWIAEAAFRGDHEAARAAAIDAADRGLFEHSRYVSLNRNPDDQPVWMHRLVRQAVRTLAQGTADERGLRTLEAQRVARFKADYSVEEVGELSAFLLDLPDDSLTDSFPQAAAAVMDLLEPLGSDQVKMAAKIAAKTLPHISLRQRDGLNLLCTALMAQARVVNHNKDATLKDITCAEEWCRQAIENCNSATEQGEETLLLRGRAEAMQGILLRKRAKEHKETDPAMQRQLLYEAIEILDHSYKSRRKALTKDNELGPDPYHHVDRGWYNLGGAYIVLTNVLVHLNPAEVPGAVSQALTAYVGSLSLRRNPGGTKYEAASLWGTALSLYTAAVHCPGRLDMDNLEAAVELDPVRQSQNRVSMLRAAELCDTAALNIWAEIDGPEGADTQKARDLLLKISLAWAATAPPQEKQHEQAHQALQLFSALGPFLEDLGM